MDCHLEQSEKLALSMPRGPMQLLIAPECMARREFPVFTRFPVVKSKL
jgi:hypothetical protein